MQITPRQSRVRPPSFRKPVSTVKAEQHRQKARDIQGFAGFTQQALGIANKVFEYEEARELQNAEVEVKKRFGDFEIAVNDPNNPIHYNEWMQRFGEERENIYSDVLASMKMPGSKEEFELRYNRLADDLQKELQLNVFKKQVLDQKADTLENIDFWTSQNNIGKVEEYIKAAEVGYIFSPEQAYNARVKAQTEIAYGIAKKEAYSRGFEEGIKLINSPEMKEILKNKGIDPQYYTDEIKDELERQLRVDTNLEKARKEEEHQGRRLEQNMEVLDMYADGTLTMDYLKIETSPGGALSDIEDSDYSQWINMLESKPEELEEEKSKWLTTDPETEAKIAKYVRRTDRTVEQKAAYIEKYHGSGLGTTEYNQYMDKIGFPEKKKKVEKNPNEETDPTLEVEIMRDIGDNDKEESEVSRRIFDNIGADAKGNPRLDPTTAKTLINFNKSYKDDPTFKRAVEIFDEAFDGFDDLAKGISDKTELQKAKAIVLEDYTTWLEDNPDESYAVKIQHATEMVNDFGKENIKNVFEKLTERQEVRAGTLGLDDLLEITTYPMEQIKKGKDKEGYITYGTPDGEIYRYNTEKDRLEYYNADKGKWKRAK